MALSMDTVHERCPRGMWREQNWGSAVHRPGRCIRATAHPTDQAGWLGRGPLVVGTFFSFFAVFC
jgi:hypothetical protein